MSVDECELCQMALDLRAQRELVTVHPGVSLNLFQGPGARPRMVLQVERHVTAFSELTTDEAQSFGRSIRDVAASVEAQPGVARCYVSSFNETPPGHIHVHLVPRFDDDAQPIGPLLDTSQAPDSAAAFDLQAIITSFDRRPRRFLHSPLTDTLKHALETWNTRLSLYGPLRRGIDRLPFRDRLDVGEVYVLLWLCVLASLVCGLSLLGSAPTWVVAPMVAVAAYRWIDLVAYAGRILLTTEQSPLQSVARSLVLFGLNLVELRLIRTTWLIADGSELAEVWRGFLGMSSGPDPSTPAATGGAAVTFASALILGLSVAMVVGKIGDTFTDTASARSSA
jgi:diadenosine tetraphosphate (Ap4A) HIT family hydrolase